jgi:2-oxoglutarate ferredoxin oxidoreductase subunit beta
MTATAAPRGHSAGDYKSDLKPIWCPGCGDFGVLQAIYRALAAVGRQPHEIAFVSGIGCSSRIPGYTTAYGFNSVHGRALPIAQGIKIARPDLLVLAAGGDGDGFAIGGGHVPHAVRRNIDITYIVMDNQIYGLTKGQLSPTSPRGLVSVTSPFGNLEDAVNPLLYMLAYGAPFVAQGTPADMPGLAAVIEAAIRFRGFAFVNVQSPCVTFGAEEQQIKSQREVLCALTDLGHDATNRLAAMDLAQEYGHKLYTGVLYRHPNPPPTFDQLTTDLQDRWRPAAPPRRRILEMFLHRPGGGAAAEMEAGEGSQA